MTVAGMDDEANFQATCAALDLLGVGPQLQVEVFTVLAAILHLGNIEVHCNDQDKGLTKVSCGGGVGEKDRERKGGRGRRKREGREGDRGRGRDQSKRCGGEGKDGRREGG